MIDPAVEAAKRAAPDGRALPMEVRAAREALAPIREFFEGLDDICEWDAVDVLTALTPLLYRSEVVS